MTAQPIQEMPEPLTVITAVPERIDANGSKWRLRSLIAMGHSVRSMARALGLGRNMVDRIVGGDARHITAEVEKRVRLLFEAWWDLVPATDTSHARTSFTVTRKRAAVENWPCPAALDEDDLDSEPGYRPNWHWLPATGTGVVDDPYPLGRWLR